MAVTAEGLIIERFPELLASIEAEEKATIDPNFNTGSDTIVGQLNNIIADRDADLWQLVQSVYDARNLDRAEGAALDDLVTILGIAREGPISTFGIQNFTGADGTTIPIGTTVRNPNVLENFLTTLQIVLTAASCRACTISVATLLDNTDYDVTVNSVLVSHPSGVSATRASIISGLSALIDAIPDVSTTIDTTEPLNHKLVITSDITTNLSVVPSTLLAIDAVTGAVNVSAENTGPIVVSANTISQIVTAVAGVTATINPGSFTTGRNEETDEELRARAKLSTQVAGTGTPEAITRTVLAVTGVTFATVQENTTFADANGIARKGYRVTVGGSGTQGDIGLAIWRSKPAGIETSGDITVGIVDAFGNPQDVRYSIPTTIQYQVDVVYTLYPEETFPTNGKQLIEDEVVAFSKTLGLGEDVLAQRFTVPIFTNIPGIATLVIQVRKVGDVPWLTNIIIAADELSEIPQPYPNNIFIAP